MRTYCVENLKKVFAWNSFLFAETSPHRHRPFFVIVITEAEDKLVYMFAGWRQSEREKMYKRLEGTRIHTEKFKAKVY